MADVYDPNKPLTVQGVNGPLNVAPNAITDPSLLALLNQSRTPASAPIGQSQVAPPQAPIQMADFQAPQPAPTPQPTPQQQAPVMPEPMPQAQEPVLEMQKPSGVSPMSTINQGYNKRIQAQNQLADVNKAYGEQMGAAYAQYEKDLGDWTQKKAELDKRKSERMAEAQKNLDVASGELAKHEFKDYWQDRSAGAKVMAAIAAAMGGYGAAMTGTQNFAMGILNNAVESDLNQQKLKYEKLKGNVGDIKDAYTMASKMFDDEEDRENAARAMLYDKVKLKAEQMAVMAKSPEAKAKAADMIGQLEVLKGEAQQKLLEGNADKLIKMEEAKAKQMKEVGERQKDISSRIISGLEVRDPRTGRLVPQIAATPDDAKKAKEFFENYNNLKTALTEIKNARKDFGLGEALKSSGATVLSMTPWYEIETEKAGKIKANVTTAQMNIKNAEQLGTLDKGSIEFLNKYLHEGKLTTAGSAGDIQLDEVLKILESKKNSFIKHHNLMMPEQDLERR